jgi:thiol-disulfide isomerase/thioredoxin
MKRLSTFILALALLTSCATNVTNTDGLGFVASNGSAVVLDVENRVKATDLTATLLDESGTWRLRAMKRSVVFLNTWGPWCAPCRKEIPELEALYKELGSGFEVVGFATRTTRSQAEAFLSNKNITFTQVQDFSSSVIARLDGIPSSTIPSTIFIDSEGRIAGWALGAADPTLLKSIAKSLMEE